MLAADQPWHVHSHLTNGHCPALFFMTGGDGGVCLQRSRSDLSGMSGIMQPNGKVAGSGENGVLNRRVTKP